MRHLTPALVRLGGILLGAALSFAPAGAVARAAETHRVTIERFAYEPAALWIRPGDTVEFVNRDLAPHTATDGEGRWDTGRLGHRASARIRFDAAGTYDYVCTFHPNMRARIRVVPQ